MFVVAQSVFLKVWLFQKSDAGIYHVFSQYFSNYHIFKNAGSGPEA